MFDNWKLPRWVGWLAFGAASLYFVAKVGVSIWWFLNPIAYPRLEPAINVIDLGFVFLWFIAATGLRQRDESSKSLQVVDRRIREHVTSEHEETREAFRRSKQEQKLEHRESQQKIADRRLLGDLWQFINWRDLNDIVDQIHYGIGDYDFYKARIVAYLYFREDNAERQLQTPELSQALAEFDKALGKFNLQLSTYADAEPQGDRWVWFPHYKYPLSQELYEYKHTEYRKAVGYGIEMLDKHKELVAVIRILFPDFFES